MKASDLVTVWGTPDNSRLTAKQYSFRLPVHVAAKLAALEDLYPTRSRTQLVADLLSAAIAEVERNLPLYAAMPWEEVSEDGEQLYEAGGMAADFRKLANQHYEAIERDLGNEQPSKLFASALLVSKDGK